jgi:hypothetical protein
MNKFLAVIAVAIFTCCMTSLGCTDKDDKKPGKTDIVGACKCATKCAENIMVDDSQGLVSCKNECAKKFGSIAVAEGLKRSMEVMAQARESCED